jgi:hypothetical protein
VSRAPQKRFLDIEQVLRWAYRDELPKDRRTVVIPGAQRQGVWSPYLYPAGYGEASPMFRDGGSGGPSGGYADGWDRDPGHPKVFGGPHPDALAVEAAVKNLDQWRGYGFVAEDPAGLTWGFFGLEAGHQAAAMEAIAAMAGTVACHARAGTRPKWSPGIPRPGAVNAGNGKPQVLVGELFAEVFDKRRDRMRQVRVHDLPGRRVPPGAATYVETVPAPPLRGGVYRLGSYCPLAWRPDPKKLVVERAEWAAWRMGLQLLWQSLEGALELIAPLPPSAPWRPWAGETEAHGKPPELFRGLREGAYRVETREQAAMRRRAGQRRALQAREEQTRLVRAASLRRDRSA